jgi:hypothetical protein
MRSLIIAALLMPPTASAPLNPADNHVLAGETTQQTIFLNQTAPNQNTVPDMNMFIALVPDREPVTTSKAGINTTRIKTQSNQPEKIKKVRLAKGKKNYQRINLLAILMMYKDSKKR